MERKTGQTHRALDGSVLDRTEREQTPPERKRGRPKGSKNSKPKPKREVLIQRRIEIEHILRHHPTFHINEKSLEDGHWIYTQKEISSESLDRNILLWIISRISHFESIVDDDHDISGCSVGIASEAGAECAAEIDTEDPSEGEQAVDLLEVDESECDERPYAFISRKYWLDRIRSTYTNHLAFLEQAGVIEIDHSYRYRKDRYSDHGTESGFRDGDTQRIRDNKRTGSGGSSKSESDSRNDDERRRGRKSDYSVTQDCGGSENEKYFVTPTQKLNPKTEYSVTQGGRNSKNEEYSVTQVGSGSENKEYSVTQRGCDSENKEYTVTPPQKLSPNNEYSVTQSASELKKPRGKRENSNEEESKSKGYRISDAYISALKKVQIEIRIPKKSKPHLPFHLTDEFFKHISFDYTGAEAYLLSLDQEHLSRKEARTLWHMAISVLRLKNKDFKTHRDLTSFRANNVVTQMNSKLRRFLTYKGQKLYSIDLSNSQPLFFALLLRIITENSSIKTYNNSIETSEWVFMCDHISVTKYSNAEYPSKTKVFELLQTMNLTQPASRIQIENTKCLQEKQQAHPENDIENFYNLCIEGRLYKHFVEIHNAKRRSKKLDKDQMKNKVLIFLMDDNDSHNNTVRSIFTKHFPNVLGMMERIKEQRYQNMGILLQCLESHTFLDVVARKLHDVYQIPFCTIHDCIISTGENIDIVKKVIMEAFSQEFGVQPNLKVTCWQDSLGETANESESACTCDTIAETYEQTTPPAEAPRPTEIDSESVYTIKAKDVLSEERSLVVEPPTSLSDTKRNDISSDTKKMMSALAEYHIDDEDLPKSSDELEARVADLEYGIAEARRSSDDELVTKFENMILVLNHGKLRMNLKKFSSKR